MENSDKENVSVNIAKPSTARKNKVYKRITLSDDSDSDFEDNGRKTVKKMSPTIVNSDGDEDRTIGKQISPKHVKVFRLTASSDESDCENIQQTKDYEDLSPESDDSDSNGSSSDDDNVDDYSTNASDVSIADDDKFTDVDPVVLGTDMKKNEEIVVHPKIVEKLFPHQIEGIKFMFDNCFNDLNAKRKYRRQDHGCILAHCMGLGKTLQIIALLQTAITYPQLGTNKILIICPKSTILNWKAEIEKWLCIIKDGRNVKVFTFTDSSSINQKIHILNEWSKTMEQDDAGVLLLGYDAFMRIVFFKSSTKNVAEADFFREKIAQYLLKPGADMVVLDEGHKIKNLKSKSSQAVNKIWTKRRIILTGTPMQNNLTEYYSMVNFIKPDFLGTKKDFAEKYGNQIQNGQHKDSTQMEVRFMKEMSYILHKKLSKFIQRRDVTVLKQMLKEKFEYDIFIPMTDIQNELYEYYLRENPLKDGVELLPDYQVFRKIWTHPKILETAYNAACAEYERKNKMKNQKAPRKMKTHSGDESSESESGRNGEVNGDDGTEKEIRMFSPRHDWWKTRVTEEQRNSIFSGSKIKILFEILNICERESEKCLVFSEYTSVLDVVEMMMKQITQHVKTGKVCEGLLNSGSKWEYGRDYCRLDGSTSQSDRQKIIDRFNKPDEKRLRAFLISSKAGGQGINLTGATRVVLLDTSWNPSNDQQSIFRVFRLGQQKNCFIYRLLAMGTMEEKVYSRSVTKQATSCRVVDKQQIERHYNMAELIELYTLTKPDLSQRPTPNMPSDKVLAHLLHKCPETVFKYHEHDSLLEKEDDLTEEEKETVWKRYEQEAKIHEAILQQENDMKMSQETPPFLDSEPKFGEYDKFLDYYNENYSAKSSAVNDSKIPLAPDLMVRALDQTYQKPSVNSIANLNTVTEYSPSLMSGAVPKQHKPPINLNENTSTSLVLMMDDGPRHNLQHKPSIQTVAKALEIAPSSFPLSKDGPSQSPVPRADSPYSRDYDSTAQKRKLETRDRDIREFFTSTPMTSTAKKSKMSLSSSNASKPIAVRGVGWLSKQSKSNQPSTSNQQISDEIIVLDD